MDWKEIAIRTLRDSLYPVPEELNELDWKSGLSNKLERLAKNNLCYSITIDHSVMEYEGHA